MEARMSRANILIVAVVCLMLGADIGLAQGVYVTANAGYGFGAGTQYFGNNSTATGFPGAYSITQEGVYGSLGKGFKFGASAGYMLSRNLGGELGFSYWLGQKTELTSKSASSSDAQQMSGSGFVAIPSIVVSADMKPINPYARIGLVLGVMKVTIDRRIQDATTYEYRWEETGNLALGYAGALGIGVPAGGGVGFFAEVALHSVTYSPSQIEITKLTVNGVNQLPTQQHLVTEYKESISTGSGTPVQYSSIAVRRPISSIGLVVGVRINL